ncbi:MAG TPA: glycine zipper family protein [Spongiibacteraceae bacterium]|nr:glycine zipper family protein [Spongiibacteraceae bacterium]
MKKVLGGMMLVGALSGGFYAHAQQPIIYPAKGQSASQQKSDEAQCGVWAKDNTGVDPVVLASTPTAAPQTQPGGQRLAGAARGALAGTAIGAVAGDTGKGAAIGATAGVIAGGRAARRDRAAAEQDARNVNQGAMNTYFRAYSACMEGRGYTVN